MYDYEKIQESINKAAKEEAWAHAEAATGSAGKADCAEESLRARLRRQRERAQLQSRNVERLAELECLLDKNPDFARILDLLELVRG